MTTQKEVFDFFQKMSMDMNKEGYRILDNLTHEFPNIPTEEEVFDKKKEQLQEQELEQGDQYDLLD